uniref:Uncharacterized protein n=1 Tax=Rhizophora mucronata TaxID=61149 RepID=A0A2P2NGL1_RHIMU
MERDRQYVCGTRICWHNKNETKHKREKNFGQSQKLLRKMKDMREQAFIRIALD